MIDVHGHVFNAAYVPISGVIHTRTPMSLELSRTLAGIFNRLVRLDPDPRELGVADPLDFSPAEMELEVELPIESDNDVAVRWLVERTSEEVLEEIGESIDAADAMLGATGELAPMMTLEMAEYSGRRRDLARVLWKFFREARGWGRWFSLLLSRESVIVEKMYRLYPEGRHFVVHMMDMDNFYDGESKLDFVEEQIPRLAALARASEGRLLPFVAFDPTRENALEIVSGAIERSGFRGVKFYPPSGYRPLNNTAADVPPGVDPRLVEANVCRLYTYCVDTGTPIFTHCQPEGMDARPGSGLLSHPAGWEPVLEAFPKLRLCIGHAGGEPAWFQEKADPAWRLKTIELCCTHENVYCEVGHLDDLLDKRARKLFRDRLSDAMRSAGTFRFADKLMYGSDYHLLVRTPNFKKIPRFLEEDVVFAGMQREAFFEGNAMRYLNIS